MKNQDVLYQVKVTQDIPYWSGDEEFSFSFWLLSSEFSESRELYSSCDTAEQPAVVSTIAAATNVRNTRFID